MKSYISNAFSMNMISDELDDFDLIVTAVDRSDRRGAGGRAGEAGRSAT